MRITLISLAIILLSSLSACKKEQVDEPKTTTDSENPIITLLKSHAWRYDVEFYSINGYTTTPYTTPFCLLDDSLVYHSNGQYLKFAGLDVCPNQTQNIDTLIWELSDDQTLKVNNQGIVTEKTILVLNNDSLMMSSVTPANDTLAFLYLKY